MPAHMTRGRTRRTPRRAVPAFLGLATLVTLGLAAGSPARAASYTWDGGASHGNFTANDNWSTPNNWVGANVPVSSADTDLIFTLSGTRTTATQNIVDPFLLHSLTFDATSNVTALTGGTLNFRSNSSSATPTLTQNSSTGTTLNNALVLTNTLSVGVTGAGGLTLGGAISGAGGLTKTGAGTLTLTGASTYTGQTTVSAGTLTLGTGGSLTNSLVSVGAGGTVNISGGSVNTGTGSYFQLGNAASATAATANLTSGSLTDAETDVGNSGTGTFTQNGGTHTVNGDLLLGYNSGGNGAYTLSGGTLTTSNTLVGVVGTGTFTQNGGTHTASNGLYLGYNSGGGGTYTLSGGTLTTSKVAQGGGTGVFNFNGGTLQASQSTTTFLQGLTSANVQSGGARIDTNGHNVTVAQALVHDATGGAPATDGGLTKTGTGTLTLTGANTYTGGTTVSAGTLSVAGDSYLGAAGGAVTINNGGQLAFTGASVTTGRVYNLGSSVTLAPASGGSLTYASGASVNGGTLGAGSHVLTDGSSLSGTRTTTNTSLSQTGGTVTFTNVTLSGNSTFTQAAGATLNSTGDFIVNTRASMTVNGTVSVAGASSFGALTINSGGQVNESGSATPLYLDGSRGTTVNSGGQLNAASGSTIELGGLLTNNGTQSGALNVNLGGVAKGSGTFGTVTVNDGGRFSPGNSPGTATVGGMTFGQGGGYNFEVANAQGTPGGGYDFIHDTGLLNITAGNTPNAVFTVGVFSLDSANNAGLAQNWDPTQNYSFTLLTADGGISGFDPSKFVVDASGFQNSTQGGSFSIGTSGNDLRLNFTAANVAAAPEPSQWAGMGIGALGLLVLGLRARRRRAEG